MSRGEIIKGKSGVAFWEYTSWCHRYKVLGINGEVIYKKKRGFKTEEEAVESYYKYKAKFEADQEISSSYYRTIIYVYDIYGNISNDSYVICVDKEQAEIKPVASSKFQEAEYLLFPLSEMTVEETESFCNKLAGSLAVAQSEDEELFIAALKKEYAINPSAIA